MTLLKKLLLLGNSSLKDILTVSSPDGTVEFYRAVTTSEAHMLLGIHKTLDITDQSYVTVIVNNGNLEITDMLPQGTSMCLEEALNQYKGTLQDKLGVLSHMCSPSLEVQLNISNETDKAAEYLKEITEVLNYIKNV